MYEMVALDIARQRAERAERRALATARLCPNRGAQRAPRRSRQALVTWRRDLAAAVATPRGGGYRLDDRRGVVCC